MRDPKNANVVRIPQDALHELQSLQSSIERVTGVRPHLGSLLSRIVHDGAEAMRRRPALAIDTATRKGDV